MKRFSYLFLAACFILIAGCAKSPTSASSGGGWVATTSNAPFHARYGLGGTVFNGKMWVIGGAYGSGSVTNYLGDVWNSSNGSSWVSVGSPSFGPRYEPQVLSFNNQLWLIGGNNSGTLKNDVWSSSNGSTWTNVLAYNSVPGANQFSPREDFGAVVFNNLMWVVGGYDGTNVLNDVWSSPDGINWTQVLAAAPFGVRCEFPLVSFNGSMFVISGGYDLSTGSNPSAQLGRTDVWSSPDGTNWTQITNSVGPYTYHQVVANGSLLWYTGGYNVPYGTIEDAALTSSNGITWATQSTLSFLQRFGHLSLSFNSEVWVIGGVNNTGSLTYYNDVWHSP